MVFDVGALEHYMFIGIHNYVDMMRGCRYGHTIEFSHHSEQRAYNKAILTEMRHAPCWHMINILQFYALLPIVFEIHQKAGIYFPFGYIKKLCKQNNNVKDFTWFKVFALPNSTKSSVSFIFIIFIHFSFTNVSSISQKRCTISQLQNRWGMVSLCVL